MKVSQRQMDLVNALPQRERFAHFKKVETDWEEVWGLHRKFGQLRPPMKGTRVFPLWPASEYAQLCAKGDWLESTPRSISLGEFLKVTLPKLKSDGAQLGVFLVPSDMGITSPADELEWALFAEFGNYDRHGHVQATP